MADRFTMLLGSDVNPATRIRKSDWTLADVAAHIAILAEAYEGYLRDEIEPVIHVQQVNADNAHNLDAMPERDLGILASRIERGTTSFLAATDDLGTDHPMRWHDVPGTVGTAYGMYLGELLIHGDDIARTVRLPWVISRTEAAIVFEAIAGVAPLFVDRHATRDAIFEINAGNGLSFTFCFSGGSLTVESGHTTRPDCRIFANPVALILVLYKRRSQWTQIARGRLFASGRRPWLAFSLANRFAGY